MMDESLKLKNQLCFPIYALSRQITAIYRPHLEKLGLTYPQYLVLMVLWERKSVTVKHLGELLWLDSGTLTPLLKRMEANGLLIRKRSSADERVVDIIISDKGKELEKKAESIPPAIKKALETNDEQLVLLREQLKSLLKITGKCNDNLI
ncbi:MAG: MarR family winged helix-turn-helix transcriptional regulator [Dysgonomonas sp.]